MVQVLGLLLCELSAHSQLPCQESGMVSCPFETIVRNSMQPTEKGPFRDSFPFPKVIFACSMFVWLSVGVLASGTQDSGLVKC